VLLSETPASVHLRCNSEHRWVEQIANTKRVGQWFKQNPGKRENIFLATKFANAMKEDGTRYVDSCKQTLLPLLRYMYADKFDQHLSTAAKHANAPCSALA